MRYVFSKQLRYLADVVIRASLYEKSEVSWEVVLEVDYRRNHPYAARELNIMIPWKLIRPNLPLSVLVGYPRHLQAKALHVRTLKHLLRVIERSN